MNKIKRITCEYCPDHLKHRKKYEMVATKFGGKRICKVCYRLYLNMSTGRWKKRCEENEHGL